jgi:SAM-dependent methyltransferase
MNDLQSNSALTLDIEAIRQRLDAIFVRHGIAASNRASGEWRTGLRAQDWSLTKSYVQKKLAVLSGSAARNGQQEILRAYDSQWKKKKPFSRYLPGEVRRGAPWIWGDLKWLMSNEAGAAVRLLFLDEVITQLNPASVLEVGAGNGINLLMLSARHPDIRFLGLEPTAGGIGTANQVIAGGTLPEALMQFAPFPLRDPGAPARIELTQGSAAALPYEDASVDMLMTSLALEQMEEIRDAALSEISRVAKEWVVMLEPFRDVNATGRRRVYVRTHDYFQGSIAELAKYGLKVEEVLTDMPHKAILGTALVVARRIR